MVFLGQVVLPTLALAIVWQATAGRPAPFLVVIAAALAAGVASVPLLLRWRWGLWPAVVLPGITAAAIAVRVGLRGVPDAPEAWFLLGCAAFSLTAAAASRNHQLRRFLGLT